MGDRAVPLWKELASGTVGGCLGILVSQPMDVAKVRLQADTWGLQASPIRVVRDMFASEGLMGLYRGVLPPLASNGLLNAVLFAAYGSACHAYGFDERRLRPAEAFAAGATAGVATIAITCPTELVKCQQQVEMGATRTSTASTIRRIVRRQGLRGLFCGTTVVFYRDVWSFGVYFAAYEGAKQWLMCKATSPMGELAAVGLSGSTAGCTAWAVAYPMDTIKTLVQTHPDGLRQPPWYTLVREVMRRKGPMVLWRGFQACMLRAIPLNATTFLGYEYTMKLLSTGPATERG